MSPGSVCFQGRLKGKPHHHASSAALVDGKDRFTTNLPCECYESGEGVPKDYAQAADWYRKATLQADVDALYKLGICYQLGKGVSKSAVEAYALFNLASVEDNDAREARDQLEKGMKMEQIMEAQARTRKLKAQISGENEISLSEEKNTLEQEDEDLSI